MARSAGIIRTTFVAGTGEFLQQVEKAEARIRQFKQHGVSDVQATGAAWRALKGDITQNDAAVEQFLSRITGVSAIVQKAFPVFGAIAFGSAIVETTKEVIEFIENLDKGQEKMAQAFRGVQEPLRLTNDQLALANARLEADIAKLEGTPRNGLKIALEEAKVAADELANSLDQDLERVAKLLEENNLNGFTAFISRKESTSFIKERFGTFQQEMRVASDEGNIAIRAAATPEAAASARRAMDARLNEILQGLIDWADGYLKTARAAIASADKAQESNPRFRMGDVERRRYAEEITGLEEVRRFALLKQSDLSLHVGNAQLQAKKEDLTRAKETREPGRPFEDRLAALQQQLDAAQTRISAAGQPERYQQMVTAYAGAQKAVLEIDKALRQYNRTLTDVQRLELEEAQLKVTQAEAEADWKTRLEQSTAAVRVRVAAQERLAAAIGQGYEAARAANIETRLAQELGAKAFDPQWMQAHVADVDRLREGFGRDFDSQHVTSQKQAVDSLNQQIQLERQLAVAQLDGAEAVRQVELADRLRRLAEQGATQEAIQKEIDLYNARRDNAAASNVAEINARASAVERLAAAVLGGAEAERQAALEANYAEMQRKGESPAVIGAQRAVDAADRNQRITATALQSGRAYRDQLEAIEQQITALDRLREIHGETFEIQLAMRNLENQRLDVLVEQTLQLRGAKDGVRAFFLEMQKDAQSAAQTVYAALTTAHEQGSRELAKLVTGQQTDFGGLFQNIGENMVQSQIKGATQKGLAALGQWTGLDLGGLAGKPDGSSEAAVLWVRMANVFTSVPESIAGNDAVAKKIGGLFGGGHLGGGVFSFLGRAFGGFRAEGGFVDPRRAYIVGERGPEVFWPQSAGTIIPNGGRVGGGGGGTQIVNHIDARGADFGVENRIRRSLQMTYAASVTGSVQAMREQQSRRPRS